MATGLTTTGSEAHTARGVWDTTTGEWIETDAWIDVVFSTAVLPISVLLPKPYVPLAESYSRYEPEVK